jgi:hypothetical protein
VDILNLSTGDGYSQKRSAKRRAFVGIGLIAAALGLSSTLAANININSGPVEFGQGVAQTVACSGDESIIVTPASTFSNEGAEIRTTFTQAENNWIYVASSAGIGIGMVVDDGEGWIPQDTVVIGFEGERGVLLSSSLSGDTSELDSGRVVIFSESRGTPATLTPSESATYGSSDFGSFEIDSSSLAIGMLVAGPGISADTVITYVGLGVIETSKANSYSAGALTFINSLSGVQGSFKLSEITVSNIPDTCTNKVFTIKIYDNESSEPLQISNWGMGGDNSVQVWWANGYQEVGSYETDANEAVVQFPSDNNVWGSSATSAYNGGPAIETADTYGSSMAGGAFKINLPVTVDASRVYKITVESQDDSDSFNVGDEEEGPFSFYDWRDWY